MARREPVVVIGSGVAGGLAAHLLSRSLPVVLVTKGELEGGSTALAQGGVAAAIGPDDSWQRHRVDTLAAGAGLGDPEAATKVCRMAPEVVRLLARSGVGFDRGPDGMPARGREGAHSRERIVHAGGDATGAHIAAAIATAIRADGVVDVREWWSARELIVSDGGVEGVVVVDPTDEERTLAASAVVLATGGYCGLYARTTVPAGSVGDGLALAAWAGAALADLEMVQFHPTAIALDRRPLPLATEALRGAGARLVDDDGRPVMDGVHPLGDLAPRDVVARAIYEQPGSTAKLVLPAIEPQEAERRFPTVAAACRGAGLQLGRDPIPVTPAAHYSIGGVLADVAGRTSVPGLFAIGECASTGLHGANRLASNSLLEGAVMAKECTRAIVVGDRWPEGRRARAIERPAAGQGEGAVGQAAIRSAMWDGLGIVRDEAGLRRAERAIADIDPDALDATGLVMRELATAAIAAARARTESRGAHWRTDFPATDRRQSARRAWLRGEPFLVTDTPGRPHARRPVKEAA